MLTPPKARPDSEVHDTSPKHGFVKDYLQELYGFSDKHLEGKMTPAKFPMVSFDSKHNVTLYYNPELHESYNIKPHYSAVLDTLGHLQTMYNASEVVPKFADTISKVVSTVQTISKVVSHPIVQKLIDTVSP